MDKLENFEDNLLLLLHSFEIRHFSCFINFEDLKQYYFTIFSFPLIEQKQFKIEEFNKFIKSNNLESYILKVSSKNYSLIFAFPACNDKYESLFNFLFSSFTEHISKIEYNQYSIISEFYELTLHEIIKEENQNKKLDTFFQYILNKVANYFEAIQGYFHLKLMLNDINYEYDYSLSSKSNESNYPFELKITFANQFSAIITLFLKDSKSDNLFIGYEKKLILQKLENTLGFLIYSFFFLTEQESYIENLEEIVVQSKSELKTKNQQLLRQLHTITEIEQSRNLIFSKIYHQLLTPLNSILGFSMYIINFASNSLSKDILNDIENIEVNALFLLYNILDIIDYTKIITNSFSCKYEPFDFHQVNDIIIKLIGFLQRYFDTKIEFDLLESDFNFVHDYKRIEQIIFSLLFFSLSSKTHAIYLLRIRLDEKEKRKLLISIIIESPMINEDYFNKLFFYKERADAKNFKEFTLEDFLAYCPIQILKYCEDDIEFEKNNNSFIINLKLEEKIDKLE